MKRVIVSSLVLCAAAPAAAHAASAQVMVVGKDRVLAGPRTVPLKAVTAKVGGRRCRVGGTTPLAALLRTRLPVSLKDYGACGPRARDAGGMYVRRVGPDAARGMSGWVFKIGRSKPSVGAGDLHARVRAGQRVLWFWCKPRRTGACPRTLEVAPASRSARRGGRLRVKVTAYGDNGRGRPAAGATVRLGGSRAKTGAGGVAVVKVPARRGKVRLSAKRSGMVPSFPVAVTVR